jgi:hypothetical protein
LVLGSQFLVRGPLSMVIGMRRSTVRVPGADEAAATVKT